MKERHITRILTSTDTSFSYTVGKSEHAIITILVTSAKSFQANIQVVMDEPEGKATIYCLVLPQDGATITCVTSQQHRKPKTQSNLLIKSFVAKHATFVFRGNIYIDTCASGSDAYQKNENMIGNDGNTVTSSPVLEILNNDVRCTHAVTTGSIPADVIWYLGTRGLSKRSAEALCIKGFIDDIVNRIPDRKTRDMIYNQYIHV